MLNLFFGFNGRINRARFWFAELVRWIALGGLLALMVLVSGDSWTRSDFDQLPVPLRIFWGVTGVIWLYVGLVIQVKRWHDRNKSGLWVLIAIIPYIGALWTFIECGCLRGTAGANRFGPDPLDKTAAHDAPAVTPSSVPSGPAP